MEQWQEKENRKFLRAGTIAAAALNPYRDAKSHPDAFTAADFFNLPRPEKPKINKAAIAASFFGVHNANIKRLERKMRSA